MASFCAICGMPLPVREGRGRPRTYCGPGCKEQGRKRARREANRQWWADNFPGIAEMQPDRAADPLAALEGVNESLAVAASAERALIRAHLPPELHEFLRTADDDTDVFELVDGGAVRIHRDGAFAFAEQYLDGELVAKGVLVSAEGQWRWLDDCDE